MSTMQNICLLFLDRVIYDLSEVPSIFLEPHFDLSKHEIFFTVFPNIFLTSDTHVNVPTANIRISDKSIQEKVISIVYSHSCSIRIVINFFFCIACFS